MNGLSLYLKNMRGWDKSVMNGAAANGHLDVVVWLNENRTEGCSKCAMNEAAINGHLDVIRWLHENQNKCGNRCRWHEMISKCGCIVA